MTRWTFFRCFQAGERMTRDERDRIEKSGKDNGKTEQYSVLNKD
jgi:hypothetical protein